MTRADHLAAHRSSRLDSTRPPGSALWVAPAMSAAADSEPDVVEAGMPVRQAREVAEARRPRDEHAMESRPWCSVAALFVGARRYTRRTSPRSSRSTAGQAPGSTRPNRERTRRPNGDLLLATDSKVTVRVSRALQRHIGGAIRSGDTTSLIDDVPRRCAPRAAPRRPQPAQQRPPSPASPSHGRADAAVVRSVRRLAGRRPHQGRAHRSPPARRRGHRPGARPATRTTDSPVTRVGDSRDAPDRWFAGRPGAVLGHGTCRELTGSRSESWSEVEEMVEAVPSLGNRKP
jgi:hypothetical protein